MSKMHHIQIEPGVIGKWALLTEDPNRCKDIAAHFENPKLIANNREYITYIGKYKGLKICVTSTGMGSPSAAIALEELIMSGAKYFLKLGMTRILQSYIKPGELIIPIAAVRMEGTSLEYIPIEFPAISDHTIVHMLSLQSYQKGLKSHKGIILSNDVFYQKNSPLYPDLLKKEQKWIDAHVLSVDNETSALFTIGYIRNIRIGSLLTATTYLHEDNQIVDNEEENHFFHQMTEICLETLYCLNETKNH